MLFRSDGKFVRFTKWENRKNFTITVFKTYKRKVTQQKKKQKIVKKKIKLEKKLKKIKEDERKEGYISPDDIIDIEPLIPDYFLDEIKIGDEKFFVKYPDKQKLIEILETLLGRYENQSMDVLYDYVALNTFLKGRTESHKKKSYKRGFGDDFL